MGRINSWAVLVAAVSAFAASSVYYVLFARQRASLSRAAAASKRPRPSKMLAEIARNLILALAVAVLFDTSERWTPWTRAVS